MKEAPRKGGLDIYEYLIIIYVGDTNWWHLAPGTWKGGRVLSLNIPVYLDSEGGGMSFVENLASTAVSGLTGGLLGYAGQSSTNKANKEINEANIAFQRETNEKNEALMRESWGRDDTAVRRRAADLTAAGMSPLLAAGSAAGNSSVVSYKAPESHQVVQQSDLAGALSGIYQGIMTQQSMMDIMMKQQQMQINQSQFALNEKVGLADATLKDVQANVATREAAKKDLELKGIDFDNRLKEIGIKYADRIKLLQYMQNLLDYDTTEYNYDMSRRYGLRTNETGNTITKTAQQLDHAISNIANELFGR